MGDFSSNNDSLLVANQVHSSGSSNEALSQIQEIPPSRPLPAELKQHVKDSVKYNAALACVSLMKVLTSVHTLGSTKSHSSPYLEDFTTYMMLHDIVYIMSLVLKIFTIWRSPCTFVPRSIVNRNPENAAQNSEAVPFQLSFRDNVITISNEAENKNGVNFALAISTKTLYYILFAYGHILYFYPSWLCPDSNMATPAGKLVFYYILCGYIYVGMPVIFAVGLVLVLPCCFIMTYFFPTGDQAPVNKTCLEKLPVIDYTEPLPGDNDCSICVMEYQKGDKIIQLKCSPLHHFHEGCLKKWLVINGICPVCRHIINEITQSDVHSSENMETY